MSQPGNAALGYPPGGPGGPTPQWQYSPPAYPAGISPPQRPSGATVITAAIIQLVQAAPLLVLGLAALAAAVSIGDMAMAAIAAVLGTVLAVFAALLVLLAAEAIGRQRWASITSVAVQASLIVASLLGWITVHLGDGSTATVRLVDTLAVLLPCSAVIVLMLVAPSSRYLSSRPT